MALSVPLGKLDAICAKLKRGQSPVAKNSLVGGPCKSYGQKDDNDNITEESSNSAHTLSTKPWENDRAQDLATNGKSGAHNGTAETEAAATPHVPRSDRVERKRKRKTATPRSIIQLQEISDKVSEKDELDDYIINNPDVTFPPEEQDENSSSDYESDYKSSRLMIVESEDDEANIGVDSDCSNFNNSTTAEISLNKTAENGLLNTSSSDSAPLDLSLVKCDRLLNSSSPKNETYSDSKNTVDKSESDNGSVDGIANISSTPVADSRDAAVLQHYAESTMNELLDIYGLGGSVESLARNVPFKYINEILQSTLSAENKSLKPSPISSPPPSCETEPVETSPKPEKKIPTLKVPKVSPA